MSATYRDNDLQAECDRLRKRVAELEAQLSTEELVPFGSNCPACGCYKRADVAPVSVAKVAGRWLVPARKKSFWRKGHPAYFRAKCYECGCEFREALKGPNP